MLNIAVWNKDEVITMQNIDGMSINFPRQHQVSNDKLKIQARSLDSLEKQYGPWNNIFLWSDTEGCELEILKGAIGLLESKKIIGMNLETWEYNQSKGWCSYKELVEFLKQYNFHPKYATWGINKDEVIQSKSHFCDTIFLPDNNL